MEIELEYESLHRCSVLRNPSEKTGTQCKQVHTVNRYTMYWYKTRKYIVMLVHL